MRVCGARIHYTAMLGSIEFAVELEILRGSFLRRRPQQAKISRILALFQTGLAPQQGGIQGS